MVGGQIRAENSRRSEAVGTRHYTGARTPEASAPVEARKTQRIYEVGETGNPDGTRAA